MLIVLPSQSVFQDHIAYLLDLIGFRVPASWLQFQDLFDPFLREDVVATADALIKAETPQQLTESFERNTCVRGTTQYP
jgi:hypothetical protein